MRTLRTKKFSPESRFREERLVFERDAEEKRSVLDGMADIVYGPAVDFGIALAQPLPAFVIALVNLPALLSGDRCDGQPEQAR